MSDKMGLFQQQLAYVRERALKIRAAGRSLASTSRSLPTSVEKDLEKGWSQAISVFDRHSEVVEQTFRDFPDMQVVRESGRVRCLFGSGQKDEIWLERFGRSILIKQSLAISGMSVAKVLWEIPISDTALVVHRKGNITATETIPISDLDPSVYSDIAAYLTLFVGNAVSAARIYSRK